MDRKNFLTTLGLIAGGSLAGFRNLSGAGSYPWPFTLAGSEEEIWKVIRKEFSFPDGFTYLNTGGIGSVPRHVRSIVTDAWSQVESNPSPGHDMKKWEALKKDAAILLGPGVNESEIALINSATEGINIILNGLSLQKGDEVITSFHEHPALNIPLLNLSKKKGIVIRAFDPDRKSGMNNVNLVKNLMNKKTRLIFISHRTTTTGQLFPVKEIGSLARSAGVFFALDGAQAPGSMILDVRDWNVDFYTFSSHKWLLAPKRTGVLYAAGEKMDSVSPVTVGAHSDSGHSLREGRLEFMKSAQRFEYGTQNELLYIGFHASLDFINAIGIEKIRKHNEELSESFFGELSNLEGCEVLSPEERQFRSSMITFRLRTKPMNEVIQAIGKENIRVRPVGEDGLNGIRVSFHIFNNHDDLDRITGCIKKIIRL